MARSRRAVALLVDYPEHVDTLARWHCEHDGRADDAQWLAFWCDAPTPLSRLARRTNSRQILDALERAVPASSR